MVRADDEGNAQYTSQAPHYPPPGAIAFKLFRRHRKGCEYRSRDERRCSCPIYADLKYKDSDAWVRLTTGVRDWSRAERKAEKWCEKPRPSAPFRTGITVTDSINQYLDDCRTRNLATSTQSCYERLLGAMHEYLSSIGIGLLSEITTQDLRAFRNQRKVQPTTQLKELTYIRTFFHWCVASDYIPKNPASALKPPVVDQMPTLPFDQSEIERLIGATYTIRNANPHAAKRAQLRARASLFVLLYTGLRISDVALLKREQVDAVSGRIRLRMMKTRQPLYVKVPAIVTDALSALPVESKTYWFWNERAKLSTVVGSMRRTIERLGRDTQINAHPHRFRDTFSVRLLEHGAKLRTVQLLLGHKSLKTTEKHYAPWVKEHQRELDEATEKLDFVK